MSRKLALAVAPLLGCVMVALLMTLSSWAKGEATRPAVPALAMERENPAGPKAPDEIQALYLSEGFEGEPFPPTGWEVLTFTDRVTYTWRALSGILYPAHTGERSAGVLGDSGGGVQSEVLLARPIQVTDDKVELRFWIRVLGQDKFVNVADVDLWVVRGAWDGGGGDDELLDPGDLALKPQGNNIWTELRYDLSKFEGETIRIAWRYLGQFGGDFFLDDVSVERKEPGFTRPHSYVIAPYKVEAGQSMTFVLVISNTGALTGTATVVRNELPSSVTHVAGTARVGLVGSGVASVAFTDTTNYVEWAGTLPMATGVLITVPVQVIGSPGDLIINSVTISDSGMVSTATLTAETKVYAVDTLVYYEAFNSASGIGWQGNQDWTWGQPVIALDHPHSWPGVWGTNLNGDYRDGRVHILTGTIDLTNVPLTKSVFLQWWEWFEGSQIGTPDTGYLAVNENTLHKINLDRTTWTERERNISAYAGQVITVTFGLTAVGVGSVGGGLYVDDVAVHVYPPAAEFEGSWKRVDRTKVAPGDRVTYTFYITNSGYATSTQGRMRDDLPSGWRVGDVSFVGAGQVVYGDSFVEWRTSDVYSMPVGVDATITAVVGVSPTLACEAVLVNSTVVAEANGRIETILETPSVSVYPGDTHYASLFDADDGALASTGDVWQWGETVAYGDGPAWDGQPAHTAPNVWGTYLGGNVTDTSATVYTLTLPALNLGGAFSLPLALQWWDWYEAGDDDHIGTVLVSSSLNLVPTEVYTVTGNQGLAWRHHKVDISDLIGHDDVRISFVYATDGDAVSGPGWYIDSMALHDDCPRFWLRPAGQIAAACRGFTATYKLDVFNWDNKPTRVAFGLSGHDWSSAVTPVSLTVPAATTETVTVTVAVPELNGITHGLQIEASADNGLSGSAAITTTATITAHWQRMAPLPAPRAFHVVVALNGALYAIGGSRDAAGTQPVSTTFRYDPATNSWSEGPEMPFPLSHIDAASVNGKIYIPGGRTIGSVYTNTTLVYSPATGWQTVEAAPTEVSPAASYETVAYRGQLVRMGGYLSPTRVTTQAWVFDPATSAWATMTEMLIPRADFAAGVIGEGIYIAGGFDGMGFVTTTEAYTGSGWSYVKPVPTSAADDRWAGAADAVLGGQFYLVGGEYSASTLDHSASFSPTLDAWTTTPYLLPRLNQPRRDLEADAIVGAIYAVGGHDASGTALYATNERLVLCPVCNGLSEITIMPQWEPLDPPPYDLPVAGQTVFFAASFQPPTTTRPIEFVWDWDDGTPRSTGQQTMHAFGEANPSPGYNVAVTATNCSGVVTSTRSVEIIDPAVYSMSLVVDIPVVVGRPGEQKTNVVNVFNISNRSDSYTVEFASQWTVTFVLPPPPDHVILNVEPGGLRTIWTRIEIPQDAEKGDKDNVTYTVTSHSDPGLWKNTVISTIYPELRRELYLPLVLKQ